MEKQADLASRKEIIVWLYSTKRVRQLQRIGYLYYVSRKRKYAIVYVNADVVDVTLNKLEQISFVRYAEVSPKHEINMDFSVALEAEESRIKQLEQDKLLWRLEDTDAPSSSL